MAMRQHHYRISVDHLKTPKGAPVVLEPLVFAARNHDDLFAIVERARGKTGLGADDAAALIIGLKLLAEIALENRDNPLFVDLREPLRDFIVKLKRAPALMTPAC